MNNTKVDDAHDIDEVMPMYILIWNHQKVSGNTLEVNQI